MERFSPFPVFPGPAPTEPRRRGFALRCPAPTAAIRPCKRARVLRARFQWNQKPGRSPPRAPPARPPSVAGVARGDRPPEGEIGDRRRGRTAGRRTGGGPNAAPTARPRVRVISPIGRFWRYQNTGRCAEKGPSKSAAPLRVLTAFFPRVCDAPATDGRDDGKDSKGTRRFRSVEAIEPERKKTAPSGLESGMGREKRGRVCLAGVPPPHFDGPGTQVRRWKRRASGQDHRGARLEREGVVPPQGLDSADFAVREPSARFLCSSSERRPGFPYPVPLWRPVTDRPVLAGITREPLDGFRRGGFCSLPA